MECQSCWEGEMVLLMPIDDGGWEIELWWCPLCDVIEEVHTGVFIIPAAPVAGEAAEVER